MKQRVLFISIIIFYSLHGSSQEPSVNDSLHLIPSLIHGRFHGQLRYNFMEADNANYDGDSYAHAAGISLKYKTSAFKHFSFTIGGAVVEKISSGPLIQSENIRPSRYEITLFNVRDPLEKTMARMEELNLEYSNKKLRVVVGRQLMETVFINPEDSRMRPTMAEAIWIQLKKEKYQMEGGWVSRIAPRSIYEWHSAGKSVGLYSQGVSTNGDPSGYAGNLTTKGIALAGLHVPLHQNLSLRLYDQWVENIFNTALLQIDFERKAGSPWYAAGQVIWQEALNHGGNIDPSKTYFDKNAGSLTFGMKIGMKTKPIDLSLNYNRITSRGRYLMPREWGKDPFFTFLPRERNEGAGDVHAFALLSTINISKSLKSTVAGGYYYLPPAENTKLNKYGMPSYYQLNSGLRYMIKNLDAGFLYVYKGKSERKALSDKYIFNKVNMSVYHLAVNYNF